MALTKVPGGLIADSTITSTDILDSTITNAKMAVDPGNASNLSSGDVPLAQLDNVPAANLSPALDDIALLAFKTQANGNLARYNLVDQSVDAFEDASGVDASASTGESRDSSGKYYSGATGGDATGGTITYSGGNTIHSFSAGATNFVVPGSSNVSWLVVGGGGGAGYDAGAGGGAGGFRTGASHAVTAQTYSIQVGSGGAGSSSGPAVGASGAVSTFDTVTSAGGGGGGSGGSVTGAAGGSGGGVRMRTAAGSGGAGNTPAISPISGETTTVQGFAGGGNSNPVSGPDNTSGGGGGASAIGDNGKASQSSGAWGDGGDGAASSISGASVTYAGGGGGSGEGSGRGGTGGTGGGGPGASGSPGTNGTDGLGGGGGGGASDPGDGGDGVVVISYTTGTFGSWDNMTLVSNAQTAQAQPTKADVVLTYTNGAGTNTINTDIIASVSRDNGTTYTAVTLVSKGTTGGHTILTANDVTISGQPAGTSMRWKVATTSQSVSKVARIHAVSLGWS